MLVRAIAAAAVMVAAAATSRAVTFVPAEVVLVASVAPATSIAAPTVPTERPAASVSAEERVRPVASRHELAFAASAKERSARQVADLVRRLDAARAEADRVAAEAAEAAHAAASRGSAPEAEPTVAAPAATAAASAAAAPVCGLDCRGARILASLRVPVPAGWAVETLVSRKGLLGWADPGPKRISLYLRDGKSDAFLSYTLHHEVGHAYDYTVLTDDDRQRWADARGYPVAGWWDVRGGSDFTIPAGDFAEAFAACHVGAVDWQSRLGGPPSAEQCRLLSELIR